MADSKISLLNPASSVGPNDVFPMVQGGANFYGTAAQIAANFTANVPDLKAHSRPVLWYDGTVRWVGQNEYYERFNHFYRGFDDSAVNLNGRNGGGATWGTNALFGQRYYRDIGIVRLNIGTSAGGCGIVQPFDWGGTTGNVPVQRWGVGITNFTVNRVIHKVCLDTASNATDRYNFISGWYTPTDTFEPRSGVYFFYEDDVNGGNWVCKCGLQNSRTSLNTSVAPVFISGGTLSHWQELMCEFLGYGNSGAGIVNFYLRDINGTTVGAWQSLGSISTNIPYDNGDFGQVVHPGALISRVSGTSNDRQAYLDYCSERNFIV